MITAREWICELVPNKGSFMYAAYGYDSREHSLSLTYSPKLDRFHFGFASEMRGRPIGTRVERVIEMLRQSPGGEVDLDQGLVVVFRLENEVKYEIQD